MSGLVDGTPGFGTAATAREVIGDLRLDGKVAIVTGGDAGIGVESVRVPAQPDRTRREGSHALICGRACLAT